MATLNQQYALRNNPHLLARISAAIVKAAEDVRNEKKIGFAGATDDVITFTAHGFSNGNAIEFFGGNLPTPLAIDTVYYVRDATANDFKVALIPGGSAVDLTTTGDGDMAVYHHTERFTWATNTLQNKSAPESEADRAVWLVVQNTTVTDGSASNGYIQEPDNPAGVTDSDVQFVVNSLINFLAGVDKVV